MLKRKLASAVVAIGVLTLAAGPAHVFENGPAFVIYFYSDSSHTTQVGFAGARCTPFIHATMEWGSSSAFRDEVFIGECIDGELFYY